MVEKQALEGVIGQACRKFEVDYMANKGYTSLSALYDLAKRIERKHLVHGKKILLVHLGDHDPSGIDMTRDIKERLEVFTKTPFDLERIALNMDQVRKYNPPENPAKATDSRFSAYAKQFGYSSWELDALEPRVLNDLIENIISGVLDHEEWEKKQNLESAQKGLFRALSEHWEEIESGDSDGFYDSYEFENFDNLSNEDSE